MFTRAMSFVRLLPLLLLFGAGPADDGFWHAGAYSFSDEMGGFFIRSVEGTGTKADPVILTQELYTASAVVLVIRVKHPLPSYLDARSPQFGFLYLELRTINGSEFAWIEFELELQEELGTPSTYSDGLSFDQRRVGGSNISSGNFLRHDREFEPHDRLLFQDGSVDPRETASFRILITDLTPQPEFYLLQDPRIPFS